MLRIFRENLPRICVNVGQKAAQVVVVFQMVIGAIQYMFSASLAGAGFRHAGHLRADLENREEFLLAGGREVVRARSRRDGCRFEV